MKTNLGSASAISRRSLVQCLAVGGAGLAATGLLGGCASQESAAQAAQSSLPETWDEEADVVIVGYGGAGAGAAVKAAEAGCDVLILEKMSEELAGGDTYCNSGHYEPGFGAETYRETSAYTLSVEDAEALNDQTNAAFEWVSSLPGIDIGEKYLIDGGSIALYEALTQACDDAGVRALYETPAVELIWDPATEEVKGVYAKRGDATIAVKARKGVVLCSGDYAANPEMISQFHYPQLVTMTTGTPAATGDGLKMAANVGAQINHLNNVCLEWGGFALRAPSEEMGTAFLYNYAGGGTQTSTAGSKLFVNMAGERFTNEDAIIAHVRSTKALPVLDVQFKSGEEGNGYVNLPMFMVMDSTCFDAEPLLKNQGTGWRIKKGIYEWSEDNKAELQKGWILQADTLEDLSALMVSSNYFSGDELTVPAEALVNTVAAYNAGCEAGTDAFGRTTATAVAAPPFYAVELIPSCMYTIGGPVGDMNGRVLDWENEPISRLYRAGNIGQGVEFAPINMAGCVGQGLAAGTDVATLESWEAAGA